MFVSIKWANSLMFCLDKFLKLSFVHVFVTKLHFFFKFLVKLCLGEIANVITERIYIIYVVQFMLDNSIALLHGLESFFKRSDDL